MKTEIDAGKRLKELERELARAKEREKDLEDTRRAMLYLLEDLNERALEILGAKKEWEATFDAIRDPIFIHDGDFRIVRANRAYMECSKRGFKEILGKPYYEVFPKGAGPRDSCLEAGERGVGKSEELRIGESVYRIWFYPLGGEKGYSIHVIRDITGEKRAEEELKKGLERIREEKEITGSLLLMAEATAGKTDIDTLMEEVTKCAKKVMNFSSCLAYLFHNGSYRPARAVGLAKEAMPFFKTEPLPGFPLAGAAIKGGEFFHTGGFPGIKWLEDAKSAVVIPLQGRRAPLGVLIGVYTHPARFGEREASLVKGIAAQVSTALEEASAYKESVDRTMELSRKIETIKVMHEIDRALLSTLDPDEVLETAARMITKVVPCDRAAVVMADREKAEFVYKAGFGAEFFPKGVRKKFEETSATEVIRTGGVQYAANLMDEKALLPLERELLSHGFLCHIRVPLVLKEGIVGVFSVGSKRPSAFSKDDLSAIESVSVQISVALENARLLADIEELFLGTIRSLSEAIDAKSRWTAGHSKRVTDIAVAIGGELGLDGAALKRLEFTAILHDIGKIGTYEAILDKPGKLTAQEQARVREHPVKGAEMIRHIKQFKDIALAIRHHHEFYDGSGYPEGLKSEAIPLFSRILAVADTIDAMATNRPYRDGLCCEAIVEELKRCSATQFDPAVVEAAIRVLAKGLVVKAVGR
jgi:putative nucleotidyltransferase with HDIG domain